MKIKQINYNISSRSRFGRPEILTVTGYAIDCPGMRICVRLVPHYWRCDDYYWRCDDYDTGHCFGWKYQRRQDAIDAGIEMMRRNMESGRYALAVAAVAAAADR